jgi:uncharacterized integral membrane protein
MATMRFERPQVEWRVWLGWMLACVASVAVTLTVTGAMVRAGSLNAAVVWAVFGSVIGASLGLMQWLVLRRQIPQAYLWVLASALGGAVIGAVLGIMQWLVLRRRVSRAYVWVLVSIVSFALGLSAGEAVGFAIGGAVGWLVGGTMLGVVVGATTGTALVWLLRQPVPEI